jgi:site-specific recombinase XerD
MSRSIPKILNEDEQQALLEAFNTRYESGKKNRAMSLVMLRCGLRVSEVCDLTMPQLDMNARKIVVREGKGGKDRQVWFSERVREALADWLDVRPEVEPGPPWVFPTRNGTRTTRQSIHRTIKTYAEKAGLEEWEEVSPHTLRHSFATDLYRETNNIRTVQKALGHADVSTTMIYTHIVDEELENSMKALE